MTSRIAHYIIEGKLGEGAMGEVFKGMDENLQMPVALKVLSPAVSGNQENLARFEIEARAAANLQHQNIAHVFFIGRTEDDSPFYAMELIDGHPLSDLIEKRAKISGNQILSIMLQSARALQFACEKNVMHRDIKPGNIMLTNDGVVKLVDFGLAKLSKSDNSLTKTGMALGTPNYLSPELAQGKDNDFRSDMYSLGITFYELLTGKLPYEAQNPMGVLMKHVQEPIPDIASMNKEYPSTLCKLIERMIAKRPAERFDGYNDIIAILEKVAKTERHFLQHEWSFCSECECLTRADTEDICSRCNNDYDEITRTETVCNARLVRFENRKALNDVAEHMKRTTQKPPEVIRSMLQHLPLLLGTRLTLQQGKALQLKFYNMGAHIDLEKVTYTTKSQHPKRMSINMNTPDIERHEIGVESKRRNGSSQHLLTIVLFLVLVACGAFAFWFFNYYDRYDIYGVPKSSAVTLPSKEQAEENSNHAISATTTKPGKQIGEEINSDSQNVQLTVTTVMSERNIFEIKGINFGTKESLLAIGKDLEVNLSRIGVVLGALPDKKFRITFDGREIFKNELKYYGLSIADELGKIVIHSKGLNPQDARFQGMLVTLISREIVRGWGGLNLPLWFEVGFSLSMLNKTMPGSYDAKAIVKNMSQYLDDELWLDAFSEGSANAYAQSADFTAYLIDNYNLNHIKSLAKSVKSGNDMDSALKFVYGFPKSKLLNDWFARRNL